MKERKKEERLEVGFGTREGVVASAREQKRERKGRSRARVVCTIERKRVVYKRSLGGR